MVTEHLTTIDDFFRDIAPYVTFMLAVMGGLITWRNFSLTTGHRILSTFGTSHGVNSMIYVPHVILENRKNRPEIISGIYLQIGHHYVIELKEYDDSPLILKPQEAVQVNLERVSFYAINDNVVDIQEALQKRNIKKTVLLSTSRGMVKTKSNKEREFLMGRVFKNALFGFIRPYQNKADEIICSDDVKYILKIKRDEQPERIFIEKNGRINLGFLGNDFVPQKDFLDTKETLASWASAEIEAKKSKNNLEFIEVLEVRRPDFFKEDTCALPFYSWAYFITVGKIFSIVQDIHLKIINYNNRKKFNKKATS